jgi:hypothetical protein
MSAWPASATNTSPSIATCFLPSTSRCVHGPLSARTITMASRATKRRSARQLAERKHSIYYELDSDDFGVEDESDEEDPDADFDTENLRPRKRRRVTRRAKPVTRAAAQSKRKSGRPKSEPREKKKKSKKKQLAAPLKPKATKELRFTGPSDGKIPNWTTLPDVVLRDIFIFASQPMHEQTTTARYARL